VAVFVAVLVDLASANQPKCRLTRENTWSQGDSNP
jgi:hypothetical protein